MMGLLKSFLAQRDELQEVREEHDKLLAEKLKHDEEVAKLKDQLYWANKEAKEEREKVEVLQVLLDQQDKENSTLKTRVATLEEENRVLTLDIANERTKVSSLKEDVAKSEVLTLVEQLQRVLAGKLIDAEAKDKLEHLDSFLRKESSS